MRPCFKSAAFNPFQSYRSSPSRMFFKIGVLKNFPIFIGKHLCCSLFLNKLQTFRPVTFLRRDSSTGIFLTIMLNFQEQLFLQNTSGGCLLSFAIFHKEASHLICIPNKMTFLYMKCNSGMNQVKITIQIYICSFHLVAADFILQLT